MRMKIKNETKPNIDLCRSCSYATIAEGVAGTQQVKQCTQLGRVPFPVTSCSQWEDKSATALWDLQQIAWVIEIKGGRPIGFLSPAERRKNGDLDIC